MRLFRKTNSKKTITKEQAVKIKRLFSNYIVCVKESKYMFFSMKMRSAPFFGKVLLFQKLNLTAL